MLRSSYRIYYPFGTPFAHENTNIQPLKYNGKELDKVHGLNGNIIDTQSWRFYSSFFGYSDIFNQLLDISDIFLTHTYRIFATVIRNIYTNTK